MTDRERLLEQVREAERNAERYGLYACDWAKQGSVYNAGKYATGAAHHALTAMALREAIEKCDSVDMERGARVPRSAIHFPWQYGG